MSQITLRLAKGSALTQTEMDTNLRNLVNSASVDITTGQLSLFTSESSGAEKQIDVRPTWIGYSGSSTTGVASVTGSLLVTGDITAQQFNTEIISSSTIFESGSTIFGDDSNDTHQITGSLLVTGSQNLEGNITVVGNKVLSGSLSVSGSTTITDTIDVKGKASKIRFHYDTTGDLPSATDYHGMFAHVHGEGAAYYAHGGNWVQLADSASFAVPVATLTAASASHETSINTLVAASASHETSITTLTAASASHETSINTLNGKTLISSSVQISGSISGSLGPNAAFIRSLNSDSISGSFGGITSTSVSGSLGVNATLIRSLTGAGISGSLGVNATLIRSLTATSISGSFTSTSASLAAGIATNLASVGTLSSDKANKSEITGSFAIASGSFSTRITAVEGSSGNAAGTISGSAVGDAQGQIKLNDVNVNVKDLQTTSDVTFDNISATTLLTSSLLKTSGDITGSGLLQIAGVGTSQFTSHLQAHCLGIGTGPSGTTGEIRAAGDITAYYSSDERLKENITNIKEPLQKLSYINGVEFDWVPKEGIHSNEGHDVGVIAQEIEKVLPELVTSRDNGYKAVRYEKIVALLIEAVKEQQLQIDELKSKL